MTPIVDCNITAINCLPPSKRKELWFGWMFSCVSQMARLNDINESFMRGNECLLYYPFGSYELGDEVVYNYKTYKSLSFNNIGNTPDLHPEYWENISDSFIGKLESSRYSSQRIVLEWALNKNFSQEIYDNGFIGFVQPDDPINPTRCTIFIDDLLPVYSSFVSFDTEELNSSSYNSLSSDFVFNTEVYDTASSYLFSVNIPTDVFNSINSDSVIAETIVRNFLDRYVIAGVFYRIILY